MKVYSPADIRNVAVTGHGSSGKTSLVAGCLYAGGVGNRLGRVDEGTTLTDFDPEEIERKISTSSGLAFMECGKTKVNLLDTPGKGIFIQDARNSMRIAEAALIVVDAVAGVEVQTEKVFQFAQEFNLPVAFVLNKLDRENADFERGISLLQEHFGRTVIPIQIPIGDEKNLSGIIDLVELKASRYEPNGDGKGTPIEIPESLKEAAETGHETIVEMVAEGDDQLMEQFFDQGTIPNEDLVPGLKHAVTERLIFPVFCCSALLNVGSSDLVDSIVNYLPSPDESSSRLGGDGEGSGQRQGKENEPVSAYVFKTVADPFAGRLSYLKVVSGVVENDATLSNFNQDLSERLSHLSAPQGKSSVEVAKLFPGDIGVVAKLKETVTGNTLGDKDHPILYDNLNFPEPLISFAVAPKSRGDEDKISNALHKILEEDPTLRFGRDQQTNEMLLSGMGQLHIEIIVARLKKRFSVDVGLKTPKIPYRETIRGRADVQGRHKKQSGGHGQYGDCKIRMEPLSRGGDFEFANEIFGGAIPRNYIPAVEKGILESASRGYLAGFPVVDFKVTLYDGSYHDVDSSELAFKIAGSLAFKKAMEQASAALLEPIMDVEVYAPEAYAGDLMGDLNSRRGRVQGMDSRPGSQIIKAQVPMAEMLSYAPTLTSMTQGRGDYTMEFSHYEIVPAQIAEKIIEQAKTADEKDQSEG